MDRKAKKSSKSTEEVARQIDENLRRVYDETLSEELPDRFKDLLAQLKSGGESGKHDG